MGKRSDFVRRPQDAYYTPYAAVLPLLPHLDPITRFDEPCCGRMDLVRHLRVHGHVCCEATDISDAWNHDALSITACAGDMFITNPPWTREILHPLIEHLSDLAPTWLLFDADWMHTKEAVPYITRCTDIVSVGRIKWIEGSPSTGKDNACWYRFELTPMRSTRFWSR